MSDLLKLDLGGGKYPKPGYINIDLLDCADIVLDLEKESLPFPDDVVDEVYSSHTFEHIKYRKVLNEICRVCKGGAKVTIKVPHWNCSMANCPGHIHTLSEVQVKHWTEDFVDYWFDGSKKLSLVGTSYTPNGAVYDEAKELFPNLSSLQIKRFIPDTCTEIVFLFEVIPNVK